MTEPRDPIVADLIDRINQVLFYLRHHKPGGPKPGGSVLTGLLEDVKAQLARVEVDS